MLESRASSSRDSVVLPAPEGDDSTSGNPRRAISALLFTLSLNVLHLLSHLVDDRLERETDAGDLDVVRLRAQRVGLAVELLRQKVELATDGPLLVQQIAGSGDVRLEPLD